MILDSLDVQEVLEDLQHELRTIGSKYLKDIKPATSNVMITCPYHGSEKTVIGMENKPSMGVTTEDKDRNGKLYLKGTCHCFTCHEVVDLPTLISDVFEKNDFGMYGRKWLLKTYSLYEEDNRSPMQIGVLGKEETEPVQFVPEELYVPYIANKHPYLLNRGISPAVIEYFKVGYNPDTGNVIFPVMDSEGNCLLIQRRSVSYKFFNNDESPYKGLTLYGYDKVLSHIREGSHLDLSTVYVVESAIDALYLWSYGKLAVALLQGVPTKEQIELLNALPVRVVVASQDTDETGMLGAWLLKTRLNDSKLVKRVVFPKTNDITGKAIKDINDLSSLQIQSISSTIVIQKPKDKRGKYNGK